MTNMKKIIILYTAFIAIFFVSACREANQTELPEYASSPEIVFSQAPETDTITVAPETTPKTAGGIFKNTGNLVSYDALYNLTDEQNDLIDSFGYERAYYKPINQPENMNLEYVSFWETGYYADYINFDTEEYIKYKWLAADDPEIFLEQIKELIENSEEDDIFNQIIRYDGIDFYIHYINYEECSVTDGEVYFLAEIQWVEEGECFYISIRSRSTIDESTLIYCRLERFELP